MKELNKRDGVKKLSKGQIVAIIVIVLVILGIAASGGSNNQANNTGKVKTSSSSSKEENNTDSKAKQGNNASGKSEDKIEEACHDAKYYSNYGIDPIYSASDYANTKTFQPTGMVDNDGNDLYQLIWNGKQSATGQKAKVRLSCYGSVDKQGNAKVYEISEISPANVSVYSAGDRTTWMHSK